LTSSGWTPLSSHVDPASTVTDAALDVDVDIEGTGGGILPASTSVLTDALGGGILPASSSALRAALGGGPASGASLDVAAVGKTTRAEVAIGGVLLASDDTLGGVPVSTVAVTAPLGFEPGLAPLITGGMA
jgi:hypothetical protein